MLKRLAILAILALSVNSGKKDQSANLPKDDRDNQKAPVVSFVSNETYPPNTDATKAETPHWYTSPEWWLCILGVPTLIFIAWQAKATEKAATGAMESGKAFIEAERAWIMAETGNIPDDFEPDPMRLEIFEILPVIANRGRTTGRIVRGFIAQIQPKNARDLPPEPDYSGEMGNAQVDFVLAPGGAAQPLRVKLSALDFLPLRRGERKLYVYGFVRYLVMGEHERETRFCFEYYVPSGFTSQPRGFYQAIDVPSAYTRCT